MYKIFMNRWLSVLALGLVVFLAVSSPPPALANTGDTLLVTVLPATAVIATATAGYLYYKNRYSQPVRAKGSLGYRGPGEFFVGGFLGAGFIPNTNWSYQAGGLSTTVYNMKIDPGITGGIKLGYFFDRLPNFGIEAEGSLGSHYQKSQSRLINPAPIGVIGSSANINSQSMLAWTMALHFLWRWGFFDTPEMPFGRLQPYVGIGPGLVVMYASADSAKNFSLEFEAGVRYMFNRNLGAFLAYKLSQQWQVELESQQLFFNNVSVTASKAVFDVTRNQIIFGLSYHF
jgi:opacity protein-like surface antigen